MGFKCSRTCSASTGDHTNDFEMPGEILIRKGESSAPAGMVSQGEARLSGKPT
jgi:hypothetical protein